MTLYQKIAAVMNDVQYLSKDDKVEYKTTKYKAISEEKVTTAVRKSLVKHGIIIIPVQQTHTKDGVITTVDVTYRIQNVENAEDYILAVSSGTGADTQDKGVGKAMTYAYKYLLLRLFAIPTGEDPDKISSEELDDKQKKKEATANKPLCSHCGKPIKGGKSQGKILTPEEVAECTGGLCTACYTASNKAS